MSRLIDTAFARLLDLEIPIVQAPVGGASTAALAAAVSNAGGLGTLSITWRDPATLPALLGEMRAATDRPFAINLVLAWDPAERLRIALAEGVRIVSFFWGDPAPWVDPVHAAGGLVLHTVGSAAEARRAVAAGVDVVVAQGWEAGGHVWGETSTMALVPRVVDAVHPAPVVAAGGIADGRGMAAALMLGAGGVWMGTRFLVAAESAAHPVWQDLLIAADETATTYTTLFDGGWPDAPLRALRNDAFAAWEAAGRPPHGRRPGEGETIATGEDGRPIPRYANDGPIIGATGDIAAMCCYAGQGVGLLARRQPAREIVREVGNAAVARVRHLASVVGRDE
ncbi:MAG: nitronate monooxygenase [Thermomicrobiales bacterium]|nr:nitronate monooxygenase [Thermomicrobiales bacterium]